MTRALPEELWGSHIFWKRWGSCPLEVQLEALVPFCDQLLQSCLTLFDTMDCNPPGSAVHGILQAGILEWVAISSSRGSFRPRTPGLSQMGLPSGPFLLDRRCV